MPVFPNPIFVGVDDDDENDEMDVISGQKEFLFGDTKDNNNNNEDIDIIRYSRSIYNEN